MHLSRITMTFPIELNSTIQSHNGSFQRKLIIRGGLTVLIGPNGSGKTHFLRAIKNSLPAHIPDKKVRFVSAGRMGSLETFRSDTDGHRSGRLRYEEANFGSKGDVARRHNIETLNGDFQTLSERADILVKVQERLRKLFQRDLIIERTGCGVRSCLLPFPKYPIFKPLRREGQVLPFAFSQIPTTLYLSP